MCFPTPAHAVHSPGERERVRAGPDKVQWTDQYLLLNLSSVGELGYFMFLPTPDIMWLSVLAISWVQRCLLRVLIYIYAMYLFICLLATWPSCASVFKCPFKFFLFFRLLLHTFLLVLFYDWHVGVQYTFCLQVLCWVYVCKHLFLISAVFSIPNGIFWGTILIFEVVSVANFPLWWDFFCPLIYKNFYLLQVFQSYSYSSEDFIHFF